MSFSAAGKSCRRCFTRKKRRRRRRGKIKWVSTSRWSRNCLFTTNPVIYCPTSTSERKKKHFLRPNIISCIFAFRNVSTRRGELRGCHKNAINLDISFLEVVCNWAKNQNFSDFNNSKELMSLQSLPVRLDIWEEKNVEENVLYNFRTHDESLQETTHLSKFSKHTEIEMKN